MAATERKDRKDLQVSQASQASRDLQDPADSQGLVMSSTCPILWTKR